jgi:GDP-mannose 6-dehydrogenase
MNVSIFGLGYVGMVNIACLSKLGHKIIGVDVKQQKVDLVKSGKSTVFEPLMDEYLKEGMSKGLITATINVEEAIIESEIALICVGTPSDTSGNVNMSYIVNTTLDIATEIKKTDKSFTIVYRSTIPPGSIENIVLQEITNVLGKKSHLINVLFLPEFLREGSAINDFYEGDRVVIGINSENDGKEQITKLFGFNEKAPLEFTNYKTAEFIKYVDNAYHATKVAFANEIYSIGSNLGVDIMRANDIFLMDTKLNISEKYLRPGAPFGGSCLPKDTRAIINLAKQANVEIPLFNGLIKSNKAHQVRLLEKVKSFEKNKILIYGLTFKQNTDDIRESPFLFLLNDLLSNGIDVLAFDENINLLNIRLDLPHLIRYIKTDLKECLDWAELIVINNKNFTNTLKEYKEKILLNCLDNNSYNDTFTNCYNLF